MARVISQMDYDRGVIPHDDNRHRVIHDVSGASEVTETTQSPRDSFIGQFHSQKLGQNNLAEIIALLLSIPF